VPGFGDYLEGAVTRAVKRAEHILADSESTRHDLVELLKVEPTRVSVIYPGVEARFARVTDAYALRSVTDRYQLPENFVLGLGTLQPRKNFEGLIKAFGGLVSGSAAAERFPDLHLVIGGGSGWMDQEILQTVNRCGLQERVRLIGFVRDQDLPALYSLASVFAFPSWYEGFGLPILEAQACGTPVVAASNSSLPEVVGEDGGLLVDAADTDELGRALVLALTDVGRRAELISAGLRQAARFRWETAAQQLLAVYERFGIVGTNGGW
jgi:glycosyltransferase involved in cell wall biosynthesis